jgi:hypothetical protein
MIPVVENSNPSDSFREKRVKNISVIDDTNTISNLLFRSMADNSLILSQENEINFEEVDYFL